MRRIKVKRLVPDAKLPTRAHDGDLGFDLYSVEDAQTRFGEITEVKTGIAIEFPEGFGGIIKDRSSLARDGITVLGGVIDSGYRGEIIVVLTHCHEDHQTWFAKGQKIAQLVLVPVVGADIKEVTDISGSDRGEKGFGSSGR